MSALRPNHFVAIPVINGKIKEKLQEVQKALLESNKNLERAIVSMAKSHITLAVVNLKGQEEIEKASESLQNAIQRMRDEGIYEMKLNFEGLGSFNDKVLFARILEDDGFAKLHQAADIVRKAFVESGVSVTDDRAFRAHLTVAKLSRDRNLRRGVKKIDGTSYREFEAIPFGQEECSKLQLLSMLKTDKATGYYQIISEATFGSQITSIASQPEFNSQVT